jgi:hypothetical protein
MGEITGTSRAPSVTQGEQAIDVLRRAVPRFVILHNNSVRHESDFGSRPFARYRLKPWRMKGVGSAKNSK